MTDNPWKQRSYSNKIAFNNKKSENTTRLSKNIRKLKNTK